MTKRSIHIGYEPREDDAYRVCVASIRAHLSEDIPIYPIILDEMAERGLFWRPQEMRGGQRWDVISDAPCSTEFSFSRFLTPILAGGGTSLFLDCDMLARVDFAELFALADERYPVQVVKHEHRPAETIKMDGQIQTAYPKKNWSSVMIFNDHPSNDALTLDVINNWTGKQLHNFEWLDEDEIGALPKEWNHLISVDPPNPKCCLGHFTLGAPSMPGWEDQEFADEWREWAAQTTEV